MPAPSLKEIFFASDNFFMKKEVVPKPNGTDISFFHFYGGAFMLFQLKTIFRHEIGQECRGSTISARIKFLKNVCSLSKTFEPLSRPCSSDERRYINLNYVP